MTNQPFQNQVALVSGGTSGIGRAIALALAEQGCSVTATGLEQDDVDRLRSENIHSETDSVSAQQLDVTDAESVEQLVARFGQLDILINCRIISQKCSM